MRVALPVIMHVGQRPSPLKYRRRESHWSFSQSIFYFQRTPKSPQHSLRFDRSDMMDPQGSSTVTADTDYTEALESLVPPSRRDSVGREAPASPPAGPASDSQWREPTDRL